MKNNKVAPINRTFLPKEKNVNLLQGNIKVIQLMVNAIILPYDPSIKMTKRFTVTSV